MTFPRNIIPFCLFVLAAVWAACELTGCSYSNEVDQTRIFRYNENNGISTLDPAFARDLEIMWVTNQLFDGLVELDSSMQVVPCIAKRWEVSDDGKVYTFFLRDSVFFHPSHLFSDSLRRQVTAEDFVFSFHRILDPSLASPGKWIFSRIDLERNGGFEALNDTVLRIYLREPFQPFPGLLTTQYANVVPREVVEHYGADFRSHPIGTGPFKLAYWYEGVSLVLHRYDHYWQYDGQGKRLPYLDAVKIDFVKDASAEYFGLLSGRYDFMSGIEAGYRNELLDFNGELKPEFSDRLRFQRVPFIKTDYLGFMVDSALQPGSPLLDSRVRQALALAINREELALHLRNNTVFPATAGFVPPVLLHGLRAAGGSGYEPERASLLLARAGYGPHRPLPTIELAVTPDYVDLMEYIQFQWSRIGVKAQIRIMQKTAFSFASAQGRLQVFRKSWLADYADAENFLSLFYSRNFCPAGPNYTHYSNSRFDQLYEKAARTRDDAQRAMLYMEMDSLVSVQVPVIPLYYDQVSHFVRNGVQGLNTNPVNMLDLRRVRKTL